MRKLISWLLLALTLLPVQPLVSTAQTGVTDKNILVLYTPSKMTHSQSRIVGGSVFIEGLGQWAIAGPAAVTVRPVDDYTLSELKDSVFPGASNPKYNFSLIISINQDFTSTTSTGPLSFGANRPRVPVFYYQIGTNSQSFARSGTSDSLGAPPGGTGYSGDALVGSPAGYEFLRRGCTYTIESWIKPYLTKILWTTIADYVPATGAGTRTRPVGYTADVSDTVCAWAWNTPIQSGRAGIANTVGYACQVIQDASSQGNTGNCTPGSEHLVSLGICAYLCPDVFKDNAPFKVALDIDDGGKRVYGGAGSPGGGCCLAQNQLDDYLQGVDSLNANGIKYTASAETDSMLALDPNGLTRIANELPHYDYRYAQITVHNHRGCTSSNQAAWGYGSVENCNAPDRHPDIFGRDHDRTAFPRFSGDADSSIWTQLKEARQLLITNGVPSFMVSNEILAPADDYSPQTITTTCPIDSLSMAYYAAGYRVVRSQCNNGNNAYASATRTGFFQTGTRVPIPTMSGIGVPGGFLNYVGSQYMVGGTQDTTVASPTFGAILTSMNMLITKDMGKWTNVESVNDVDLNARAFSRRLILVTHISNWRNGVGGPPASNIGRPGWYLTRQIHGAMMAAKWLSIQHAKSNGLYLKDGPMKWVWAGELTAAEDVY